MIREGAFCSKCHGTIGYVLLPRHLYPALKELGTFRQDWAIFTALMDQWSIPLKTIWGVRWHFLRICSRQCRSNYITTQSAKLLSEAFSLTVEPPLSAMNSLSISTACRFIIRSSSSHGVACKFKQHLTVTRNSWYFHFFYYFNPFVFTILREARRHFDAIDVIAQNLIRRKFSKTNQVEISRLITPEKKKRKFQGNETGRRETVFHSLWYVKWKDQSEKKR